VISPEVAKIDHIQVDSVHEIICVPIVIRVIVDLPVDLAAGCTTNGTACITLDICTPARTARSTVAASTFHDSGEVAGVVWHR
jgi:hypothetical protein